MVLNGGYVEQFGTPIELYDRPETVFVAGFIGSPAMNFLPAEADGGVVTLANGVSLPGAEGVRGKITFGVRPEHLVPDAAGPIRVQVQVFEALGANTLVHGVLEGTDTELVVSLPGHETPTPGDVLCYAAPGEHHHLFDAESGARIAP